MARLLVIEDDLNLSDGLKDWLESHNFVVDCISNGADALQMLEQFQYDTIILDWDLPELSGIELCRQFRQAGGKTPILMLTAKNLMDDKIAGLDTGADDYLGKPFDLDELTARIRALLRRSDQVESFRYDYLDLMVEPDTHCVCSGDTKLSLTPHEFKLIESLIQKPGLFFTLPALVQKVFAGESTPDSVRISLGTLRQKLEQTKSTACIEARKGLGYRLVAKASAE